MRYNDLDTLICENKMVDSNEPMSMEFGFRINGKSGRYLLETNDTQLIHERLEYVLTKNKGTYFDISTKQITKYFMR